MRAMKWIRCFDGFGFAIALMVMMAPAAWSAEHVRNGDFDVLSPEGLAPADWVYIASDGGRGNLSVGEGIEGGHSAKITYTEPGRRWGPGLGQVGVVEVKAGQWYELSFWARQEGTTTGVIVGLRDMKNWDDNVIWEWVYPGTQWRRFRLPFQPRRDLSKESSRLQFSFDSPGTVWIDRVSLVETPPPPFPNLVDLGKVKNKVPNSSFEVGTFGWGTYGSTFLVGGIDETAAAHGRASFKLDLSPGRLPVEWNDFNYSLRGKPTHTPQSGLSLASVGYVPVAKGEPLCLSASLKLNQPGKVRLGLIEDTGADCSNTVEVATEWKRCAVTLTPRSDHAFVRFAIEGGTGNPQPTILWVDAVQLEAGERPTEYEPALPIEVGFDTGREGNLYHVGEAAEAKMLVFNSGEKDGNIEVRFRVEDFFHQTVRELSETLRVSAGKTAWRMIGLPDLTQKGRKQNTDAGFYRLHARWDSAAGPQHRRFRFGIIHPLRDTYKGKDTFLGQNHSFVDQGLMRLTRDAGTSWVRSWFVRWDDVEPKQGRFDFAEADAQLAWLEKLDFHVQFCLGDPSSEWASTAPVELKDSTGDEAESRRVWWKPRDMQAYEDYVTALVTRYGDRVRQWEILNEPVNVKGGPNGNLDLDRSYPLFLQAARRAAKRAGKEVQVVGAGLDYFAGMKDLSPVVSAIDLLSEHRYPGLQSAREFADSLRPTVESMRKAGAVRPIWITEYGLYADDDPDPTTMWSRFLIHEGEDSELIAATCAMQHEVVALANGVEKLYFHIGNWPILLDREHGCGFHPFFEWNGLPRKMFVTQNVLCWAIPPGSRFAHSLSDTPPLTSYEFTTPRGATIIAWASRPVTLSEKAKKVLEAGDVQVYNVAGRRLRKLKDINESPLYILTKDPDASQRIGDTLKEASRSRG